MKKPRGRPKSSTTSAASWKKRRSLGKQWLKRIKGAPLRHKKGFIKKTRLGPLKRLRGGRGPKGRGIRTR